ncbi:hypothetical protein JW935_19155 [candidate division KSB1 bacterium]|nr:hypothetical protein [candidate division KSB1 bacterium]
MRTLFGSLLLIIAVQGIAAQSDDNISYKFNREHTTYTFSGEFKVDCETDTLLSILYDFEHLKNVAPPQVEVELLEEGENYHTILYNLSVLFFNNQTVIKKSRQGHQIDFQMLSSSNVVQPFPKLVSSTGYYKVLQRENGTFVQCYQQTRTNLTIFKYCIASKMRQQAVSLIYTLRDYINNTCPHISDQQAD